MVGNVRRRKLTADTDPQYYLPWAQAVITSPTLCIRTTGDPAALVPAVRAQVAEMDRNIPVHRVRTLDEVVYRAAAEPRFQTLLLASFAVLALLLSAVGLYAVLSYMVVERTPEIGVRMALGAQRDDVLSLILRRGLVLALTGVAIGLGASALLTRFLAGMLYGVRPFDPATYAAVTAILLLVALLASLAPAWRAASLDPIETLRQS